MEIKCNKNTLFASKVKNQCLEIFKAKQSTHLGMKNNIRSFISDAMMHFTEYSSEGVCVKNLLTKVL